MSLDSRERAQNASELRANFELAGRTAAELASALGLTQNQLDTALSSSGDPVSVWLLRDYLVNVVTAAGREPAPFTILTEDARASARIWFDLREAPAVPSKT
jgi:hypothetical protein